VQCPDCHRPDTLHFDWTQNLAHCPPARYVCSQCGKTFQFTREELQAMLAQPWDGTPDGLQRIRERMPDHLADLLHDTWTAASMIAIHGQRRQGRGFVQAFLDPRTRQYEVVYVARRFLDAGAYAVLGDLGLRPLLKRAIRTNDPRKSYLLLAVDVLDDIVYTQTVGFAPGISPQMTDAELDAALSMLSPQAIDRTFGPN
jgi:hypothetical protein